MLTNFFSIFCCSSFVFLFLSSWGLIPIFVFCFILIWRHLRVGFFCSIHFYYLSFCEIVIHNQRPVKTILFNMSAQLAIFTLSWIPRVVIDKFHSLLFIFHNNFFVEIGKIRWHLLFLFLFNKRSFQAFYFWTFLCCLVFLWTWLLIQRCLLLWFLNIQKPDTIGYFEDDFGFDPFGKTEDGLVFLFEL